MALSVTPLISSSQYLHGPSLIIISANKTDIVSR
jgi:hypothetical protein